MKRTNIHPLPSLAESITKAASKQTYYTIRFLVDRDRVADAYRAYAYFRWVDDILDADAGSRPERISFINRQKALLKSLCEGVPFENLCAEENMLLELVKSDGDAGSGLQAYLHNMMAVMSFDVERRGRLVTQAELDQYTHWLAVAVTEAMHYFIGHGNGTLHDETRYLAVTAAHITHMLRDALEDARAGYFNIPRERVAAYAIRPWDVKSKVYRDWVNENVKKARLNFKTGRKYLAGVENFRCRIAGYSYIRRFEIVLDSIEREGCLLREDYPERKTYKQRIKMLFWAIWMALNRRQAASVTSM